MSDFRKAAYTYSSGHLDGDFLIGLSLFEILLLAHPLVVVKLTQCVPPDYSAPLGTLDQLQLRIQPTRIFISGKLSSQLITIYPARRRDLV